MGSESKQVAGRYRLHEQIGSGGMGTVWRATDEVLGRQVAIKRLKLPRGADDVLSDQARERVRREARIAARLHHPAVVTVFDVLFVDEDPWLVLEYVESESLAAVLAARGPLPPWQAAAVGARVAEALSVAHAAGVVHRDVKPGNVLLATDGSVKLADFGIAHAAGDLVLTGTGLLTGTPAYLAPEVAEGTAGGPAADVYSLGATLYEAVEGRPPHGSPDGNMLALLRRMATEDVPAPQRAGPLGPLLRHLLAHDPAARPTADQARAVLAGLVGGPGGDEPRGHGGGPPVRRSGRLRPALVTALGLALVAALVVTFVVVGGRPAEPPGATAPAAAPTGSLMPADRSVAEPCSLVDPAAFTTFGSAVVDADVGGYGECQLSLSPPSGGVVLVLVAFGPPLTVGSPLTDPVEIRGGRAVSGQLRTAFSCQRTILLPDRTQVVVSAIARGGADVDGCQVADVGTDVALERLHAVGITERTAPAPDSLARVDACSLLDASDVAAAGIAGATAVAGHANLGCWWKGSTRTIQVDMARARPLSSVDGEQLVVSGRPVWVLAGGYNLNPAVCITQIPHRTFTSTDGTERVEVATVVFTGDGSPDELCRTATDLAAATIPRLPPLG